MKWFPKDVTFDSKKYYNLVQNTTNDVYLIITLGEDGQALIWDIKFLLDVWNPKNLDKLSTKNDISKDIRPAIKIDLNKTDCILIC